MYVDQLCDRLKSASQSMDTDDDTEDNSDITTGFDCRKALLRLAYADSCIQQDNFPVALKILKRTLPVSYNAHTLDA